MKVHTLREWRMGAAPAGEIRLSLAKNVAAENEVIDSPHYIDSQGMAHPRRFS